MVQLHRWLTVNEMKTKLIGQIHDSLELSFHPDEIQTVLRKAERIMCHDIRNHWKWINVPLGIDVEVAPVGGTWADKQKMEIES
jgi:DNA polymerase I-like protein with 3'-5' exonuclease and polymerase domains